MINYKTLAYIYALMFVFVVILGYIPGVNDENGLMFGLFSLELHDDLLHLFSAIWVFIAVFISKKQVIYYFKYFGIIYFLDGLLGLITGSGYLDLGIFLHPAYGLDLTTRIFANIPHLLIGGVAAYIGWFYLTNNAHTDNQ